MSAEAFGVVLAAAGSIGTTLFLIGKRDQKIDQQSSTLEEHKARIAVLEQSLSKIAVLDERTTRMADDIREIRDTLRDAQP